METIFDFNPTDKELSDIRFDAFSLCLKFGIKTNKKLTPELYKEIITQESAYYDLALLFEFRKIQDKAEKYWNQLPKQRRIDGLGFDCINISE